MLFALGIFLAGCLTQPTFGANLAGGGGGSGICTGAFGGGGGTSSETSAGVQGGPGGTITSTCGGGGSGGGGGGGGAGLTGGDGGDGGGGGANFSPNGGGPGGAGGASAGANGHDGNDGSVVGGGGGGGGGAHGAVVTTSTSNAGSVTGGNGGDGGGKRLSNFAGGGGGGAGGYGVVVNGSGLTYANRGMVAGGNAGQGGYSDDAVGGFGGDGGHGIVFTGASDTLVNSNSIAGGNGGAGGYGLQSNGFAGRGGIGVSGLGQGLTIINSGSITGGVYGNGTRADAIEFAGNDVLELQAGSTITGQVAATTGDTLRLGGTSNSTFDVSTIGTQYVGFQALAKTGTSTWTLTGTTTTSTPWTINQGALAISSDANLGLASGLTFNGGTLQFLAGFSSSRTMTLNAGGGSLDTDGNNVILSGTIGGTGSLTKIGSGTLTLSGTNTYGGGTAVNAGTLQVSGAGTLGATAGTTTVNSGGTLDLGGTTQTQAAVNLAGGTLQNGSLNAPISSTGGTINGIGGTASLTAMSGTTIVNGTNTYTGGTTVTNATLTVNGSLSDPTIGAGGILNGTGSVGDTTIQSGGTLAPGNASYPTGTLTITGNLAFQSGAVYLVQVTPSGAASTAVAGTASLGGATVNAVFGNGNYWVDKTSTIVTASGGVHGTFGQLVNTNLSANFKSSLSYDATHAYLNLSLNYTPGSTPSNPGSSNGGGQLSGNQQGVGSALVSSFNSNNGIPLVYGMLSAAGLTQASGELATASQQTTFDAMSQFMGLLTDPFMQRNGAASAGGAAGFAEEGNASSYAANPRAEAFAMFTKAPPRTFEQRWSVWGAGFGGSQSTNGNAFVGSNDTTSSIYGTAVGADYLFSPNTLAGFALAGGATNFSVNGLGTGRSDLFQAGAYLRHTDGPVYLSAALAYGWQDITTDRYVAIAGMDHLRAEFNANAYSGRVEGGYRFVAPVLSGFGITPYAAGQLTTFDLPAYAEQVLSGASAFALAYGSKSVTDGRSELGIRSDKSFAVPDGVLTLRGRLAWAHDFNPDRAIAATFQALPGASFVVNGAAQAPDSALTTASVEMKWLNGWSAAATFEGEFSDVTRSYAGKGILHYVW